MNSVQKYKVCPQIVEFIVLEFDTSNHKIFISPELFHAKQGSFQTIWSGGNQPIVHGETIFSSSSSLPAHSIR